MARMTGMEALRQKIEKAQDKVVRTKTAYDQAIDELQKLLDKQTALQAEEIVKAIASSKKSYEEILRFIKEESEANER